MDAASGSAAGPHAAYDDKTYSCTAHSWGAHTPDLAKSPPVTADYCAMSARPLQLVRHAHPSTRCFVAPQVSAQALRVTEQMVHIIRPDPGQSVPAKLKVSSLSPCSTSSHGLITPVITLLQDPFQPFRTRKHPLM